jgi:hypothetical protein
LFSKLRYERVILLLAVDTEELGGDQLNNKICPESSDLLHVTMGVSKRPLEKFDAIMPAYGSRKGILEWRIKPQLRYPKPSESFDWKNWCRNSTEIISLKSI